MKIAWICPVRSLSEEQKTRLLEYTNRLEKRKHEVHLPFRDTDQTMKSITICAYNTKKIAEADLVCIYYTPESQGTHFDIGVAFALKKKIRVVRSEPLTIEKSFQNMLSEWQHFIDNKPVYDCSTNIKEEQIEPTQLALSL